MITTAAMRIGLGERRSFDFDKRAESTGTTFTKLFVSASWRRMTPRASVAVMTSAGM